MWWKSSAFLRMHIDAERRGHDGSADGGEDLGVSGCRVLPGRTRLANRAQDENGYGLTKMQLVLRSQIGTLCLRGSGTDDPTTVSSTRASAWAIAARSITFAVGSLRTKSRKPQTRTGKPKKMENAKTPTDTDHGKSTATHIANVVGRRYKHFDETSLLALASHRDTAARLSRTERRR